MLALAGIPLGLRFRILDPSAEACAQVAAEHVRAPYTDPQGLSDLAHETDVITFEFENVDAEAAHTLADKGTVYPSARALEVAQDRLSEKTLFQELDIPVPPFQAAEGGDDLIDAVDAIGFPSVVKTRRFGYDGKGQMVLRSSDDLARAEAEFGDTPVLVESLVDFAREISVIAVRSRNGETAYYPVSENTHEGGILRLAVSRPGDPLQEQAEALAARLLEALDYVGVLALELFVTADGNLLANEMAPRVHNSGHWTIEGAETSQFENHLRAICGLPLGSTQPVGHAACVNIIGNPPADPDALMALAGVHIHDYDKAPREGRKIGHINVRADSHAALTEALDSVRPLL